MIVANTTPLAISSCLNFSNVKKIIMLRMAPSVMILPIVPLDELNFIPSIKEKLVKSSRNKAIPNAVLMMPISNP